MKRPVILLDCDGPLANFTAAYLDAVYEHTGYRIPEERVTQWAIHQCEFFERVAQRRGMTVEQLSGLVSERVVTSGFCEKIRVQPGAQDAVAELQAIGEVYVVTSPWATSPTWSYERGCWIKEHFNVPFERTIHTTTKSLICGDVFVDDKPSHVTAWGAAWPEGDALLFDMHHNRIEGEGLHRSTWADVIRAAKAQASGASDEKTEGKP